MLYYYIIIYIGYMILFEHPRFFLRYFSKFCSFNVFVDSIVQKRNRHIFTIIYIPFCRFSVQIFIEARSHILVLLSIVFDTVNMVSVARRSRETPRRCIFERAVRQRSRDRSSDRCRFLAATHCPIFVYRSPSRSR